jgi:UDP-glucose 6-dehydrogenase
MLVTSISFFNELASYAQRRETMLVTSVSFFNELATEKRNYARAPMAS